MAADNPVPTHRPVAQHGLEILLLGEVSIRREGRRLAGLPSRKADALLIYLACTRRPAAREVLADLLWDDRPQKQALANLRTILSSLRRALGDALTIDRDSIAFNRQADYWLDVEAFERQIAESKRPGGPDKPGGPQEMDHLRAAGDLYRGDFLAGFHLRQSRGFEEWATLERERLRRLAVLALRRLVRSCTDTGDYARGVDSAAQLLTIDPLSEEAHRHMMLLLARTGQRAAALAQYETCRRTLSEELGVTPTAETTRLSDRIRSAESLGQHNLPPPASEFVGREAELEALTRQLARPACRMVTILGLGGIGKTRLAVETARQIVDQRRGMFLHGLRLVPLAGLHSARLLAGALADAPDIPESGDPKERLLAYLREREMLLILDNFEHLLGDGGSGVDLVAEVLAGAPMVKLLVTSRERLDLQEEELFDLGGLSVPASDDEPAEGHGAIQLFLASARRARRDFSPAGAEWRALVAVCRILQGTPLGIELAAAAIRQQSCVEIASALSQSLDTLTSGLRNVPERHRSLRAMFEHSWTLLPGDAQDRFARLSVFADTFDGAAAEAIAGVGPAELSDLMDKSLVQRRPDGRSQIHPLLRQYAAEKLSALPDQQAAVARRHAGYYMDLAASQGDGEAPGERAAIHQELANIRAAWRWAASHGDHATVGRVSATLHNFFSIQSWFQEGIDAFRFAVEQLSGRTAGEAEQAVVLCDLLMRQARMQAHIGQVDAARAALEGALAHLASVADPDRRSTILGYLAITYYYAGDYVRAAGLAEESLRLAEQTGSQEGIAFAYNFLGSCAKAQGDYARATECFERAVEVYHAMGDGIGAAMVFNNLGNLAQARGDFGAARRYYGECSSLFRAHDHLHGAATTLANEGRLAIRQGDYAEARRLLSESLELKRKINDQRGVGVALLGLGDAATATGDFAEARRHLAQALALAEEAGDNKLALDGVVALAALAARLGRPDPARGLLAFALEHPATSQESREWAGRIAAEVGGLPEDLAAEAGRWVSDGRLAEAMAKGLSAVA